MEQQLINALLKLFSKAGGGSVVKDLIQQVEQNRNPKVWTPAEIKSATDFISWQTENFGAADASIMIETLRKKYNIGSTQFEKDKTAHEDLPEIPGVHGLR
jgi:hypothetical protein